MKITHLLVGALTIAACTKGPQQSTFPDRQLGESTASPGANASKPAPLTPDDPRVMNVSAGITPAQASQAIRAPLPPAATPVTTAPTTPPTTPAATPRREQSPPNPATSSTPVQPPTDIAPATTAAPEPDRPGVFSPPPPPPR